MKAIHFFHIGLAVDAFILVILVSNLMMMRSSFQDINGMAINAADGFSNIARMFIWLIPLLLLALMGTAFWLKNAGKLRLANILLWIPALPMAGGIILWGGLAILFLLSSVGK